MPKTIIPSSYDKQTVWILPLVFITLLYVLFFVNTGWVFQVSMAIIFLSSILVSLILVPNQIQKEDEALILKRFAGDIILKKEDILKIETIEFTDLRRKIGINGLLGYYGYFTLAGFGQVKVMAKSKQTLILIQSSKQEPIVVSVDELEEVGF